MLYTLFDLRFENRYLKAEIGDHVSFDTVTHSCKLGGVTFLVTITPCVLSSGTRGKQEMEIIKVAIGAYDPKRSPFDRGFYIGSIALSNLCVTRIKKKKKRSETASSIRTSRYYRSCLIVNNN